MSEKIAKTIVSSKPIRMWIDGKCFNIKPFKTKWKTNVKDARKKIDFVEDKLLPESPRNVANSGNIFNILKDNETGKFSTFFELPSLYYNKLQNNNEEFNIKFLSDKTKTEILVPKHGNTGKLIVSGDDEENVKEAIEEIHSFVGNLRDRNIALQFIGIPLKSEELQKNFEIFKNQVLADNIKGMDESIFQTAAKLHVTINVLVLLDDREKKQAIDALNEYKDSKLSPLLEKTGPLKVVVSGIDCMNDNHSKVDVLYANIKIVDETQEANLQTIVNDISNYFYEKGLLKRHQENVKLHVTLINTKYRKIKNSPRKKWVKRESIDARPIMEKYKDFYFGVCNMDSIHISLISSIGEDGFYKPLSIVKF